jgi:hypothetical protein
LVFCDISPKKITMLVIAMVGPHENKAKTNRQLGNRCGVS